MNDLLLFLRIIHAPDSDKLSFDEESGELAAGLTLLDEEIMFQMKYKQFENYAKDRDMGEIHYVHPCVMIRSPRPNGNRIRNVIRFFYDYLVLLIPETYEIIQNLTNKITMQMAEHDSAPFVESDVRLNPNWLHSATENEKARVSEEGFVSFGGAPANIFFKRMALIFERLFSEKGARRKMNGEFIQPPISMMYMMAYSMALDDYLNLGHNDRYWIQRSDAISDPVELTVCVKFNTLCNLMCQWSNFSLNNNMLNDFHTYYLDIVGYDWLHKHDELSEHLDLLPLIDRACWPKGIYPTVRWSKLDGHVMARNSTNTPDMLLAEYYSEQIADYIEYFKGSIFVDVIQFLLYGTVGRLRVLDPLKKTAKHHALIRVAVHGLVFVIGFGRSAKYESLYAQYSQGWEVAVPRIIESMYAITNINASPETGFTFDRSSDSPDIKDYVEQAMSAETQKGKAPLPKIPYNVSTPLMTKFVKVMNKVFLDIKHSGIVVNSRDLKHTMGSLLTTRGSGVQIKLRFNDGEELLCNKKAEVYGFMPECVFEFEVPHDEYYRVLEENGIEPNIVDGVDLNGPGNNDLMLSVFFGIDPKTWDSRIAYRVVPGPKKTRAIIIDKLPRWIASSIIYKSWTAYNKKSGKQINIGAHEFHSFIEVLVASSNENKIASFVDGSKWDATLILFFEVLWRVSCVFDDIPYNNRYSVGEILKATFQSYLQEPKYGRDSVLTLFFIILSCMVSGSLLTKEGNSDFNEALHQLVFSDEGIMNYICSYYSLDSFFCSGDDSIEFFDVINDCMEGRLEFHKMFSKVANSTGQIYKGLTPISSRNLIMLQRVIIDGMISFRLVVQIDSAEKPDKLFDLYTYLTGYYNKLLEYSTRGGNWSRCYLDFIYTVASRGYVKIDPNRRPFTDKERMIYAKVIGDDKQPIFVGPAGNFYVLPREHGGLGISFIPLNSMNNFALVRLAHKDTDPRYLDYSMWKLPSRMFKGIEAYVEDILNGDYEVVRTKPRWIKPYLSDPKTLLTESLIDEDVLEVALEAERNLPVKPPDSILYRKVVENVLLRSFSTNTANIRVLKDFKDIEARELIKTYYHIENGELVFKGPRTTIPRAYTRLKITYAGQMDELDVVNPFETGDKYLTSLYDMFGPGRFGSLDIPTAIRKHLRKPPFPRSTDEAKTIEFLIRHDIMSSVTNFHNACLCLGINPDSIPILRDLFQQMTIFISEADSYKTSISSLVGRTCALNRDTISEHYVSLPEVTISNVALNLIVVTILIYFGRRLKFIISY
jgi:hypothetical protein